MKSQKEPFYIHTFNIYLNAACINFMFNSFVQSKMFLQYDIL